MKAIKDLYDEYAPKYAPGIPLKIFWVVNLNQIGFLIQSCSFNISGFGL